MSEGWHQPRSWCRMRRAAAGGLHFRDGARGNSGVLQHDGEECGYVLEGRLSGAAATSSIAGRATRSSSWTIPHTYRNPGKATRASPDQYAAHVLRARGHERLRTFKRLTSTQSIAILPRPSRPEGACGMNTVRTRLTAPSANVRLHEEVEAVHAGRCTAFNAIRHFAWGRRRARICGMKTESDIHIPRGVCPCDSRSLLFGRGRPRIDNDQAERFGGVTTIYRARRVSVVEHVPSGVGGAAEGNWIEATFHALRQPAR